MISKPSSGSTFPAPVEEEFYSSYSWCLNPLRQTNELLTLLEKELHRLRRHPVTWEEQEIRTNLHIFSSAIACIIDDYLSWLPLQLQPLMHRSHRVPLPLVPIERIANAPYLLATHVRRRSVYEWRRQWTALVDEISELLLSPSPATEAHTNALLQRFTSFRSEDLPPDVLNRRLRIIEGYRCQDLTHYDVCELTKRFAAFNPDKSARVFIIGPRTAGAYFAPVVRAYLRMNGYTDVAWMTVRPKWGLSTWERKEIRQNVGQAVRIVLTDDHSSSGRTFRLLQMDLSGYGIRPSQMTLLAPIHPRRPLVVLTNSPETRVIMLAHSDLYKRKLMMGEELPALLREYLRSRTTPADDVSMNESAQTASINDRFWKETADSFQVRLKKVFEFRIRSAGNPEKTIKVLAKSVGWGWLGYHAYIAGRQLEGFVPPVFGLREGMLFMEWIDNEATDKSSVRMQLFTNDVGSYIARRRERLKLNEDPRFMGPEYGWGWQEILQILHRPYGVRPGYLKNDTLRRMLAPRRSQVSTFVDGRMFPEDWVFTNQRFLKTDFEHHNFGPPNLEMVDPAFDLAAAAFECRLSSAEESAMVDAYCTSSGDETIRERLILYKLLYGRVAKQLALVELLSKDSKRSPDHNHRRHARSWDFLVCSMTRYCAEMIGPPGLSEPSGNIFFLDIDGVLDTGFLGFPHTTPCGLTALALLRQSGYSVIPNTGRSIAHIREYCEAYGFEAGVAEYGSVIFQPAAQKEISLVSAAASDQIAAFRTLLEKMPGVFVDPSYRYAIRAYRFDSRGTIGLSSIELEDLLRRNDFSDLRAITQQSDSYVVSKDVDKGKAVSVAKDLLGRGVIRIAAIGNSDDDIPMLQTAGLRFAPRNSSQELRALARRGFCTLTSSPNQRGFLEAVRSLPSVRESMSSSELLDTGKTGSVQELMYLIMRRTDQSRLQRLFALLRKDIL